MSIRVFTTAGEVVKAGDIIRAPSGLTGVFERIYSLPSPQHPSSRVVVDGEVYYASTWGLRVTIDGTLAVNARNRNGALLTRGSTVTDVRGIIGQFQGVSRRAGPNRTAKVIVDGGEYYATVWGITIEAADEEATGEEED